MRETAKKIATPTSSDSDTQSLSQGLPPMCSSTLYSRVEPSLVYTEMGS